MPFLALLSLAKRFWPYLAGAIAIAAVWAAVLHYGAKREAEGVAKERATWQPVVAAIKVQNERLAVLQAASEQAAQSVAVASQRAQEARKANAGLQARLKAAGRAKGDCTVAAVNKEAWGVVR